MVVFNWMLANWSGVVSIIAMLLAVGVAIAHMAHADNVATSIQGIEDTINKLIPKP